MKGITTLHIVQLPSGRFGYAGRVPCEIGYLDATPEKMEAAKFGERFGPKKRTFSNAQEAETYAISRGFSVFR